MIEVQQLTKQYGDFTAVNNISFKVERGEILGFLGPNGAGKTTTVEILEGFRRRSSGTVEVLGVDPEHAPEPWRARVGVVLQSWRDHGTWRVSDLLEVIADTLPDRLDYENCLRAAALVGPLLRLAHEAEEAQLFPRIAATHVHGAAVVERLRLEHLEDESFGEEVQYELHRLGCKRPALAPEATGYMLRGFFECLRRHVLHERELLESLLPLPARATP